MKISVFGLGYVGTISAACLAKEGHTVIGVDPVESKVNLINNGMPPIIEQKIDKIIKSVVNKGALMATCSAHEAIKDSELSLICVGTPSQTNGNLDTRYIQRVCQQIGEEIKIKATRHVVVIRSTILPGSIRETIIPILEEHSGKIAGRDFGVCNNPEFLREGTAVDDFYNPPKTIIGQTDAISGDLTASIYENMNQSVIRTTIEIAEMIKYVDNVWHALKVGFGNEIGNICKKLGIDSHEVMDIFCSDTKLNISTSYLKPGFAFGGSCLPKDVRALSYKGKSLDIQLPILNAILPSNQSHIHNGLRMVMESQNNKVGFLGFSFKEGTDDLRESPIVEMIERLLGKGYDIKLYDNNVNIASLIGSNKDYILNKVPHIAKLMVKTMDEVIEHAQTIVIGNNSSEFKNILSCIHEDQLVIDLVRTVEKKKSSATYKGICW